MLALEHLSSSCQEILPLKPKLIPIGGRLAWNCKSTEAWQTAEEEGLEIAHNISLIYGYCRRRGIFGTPHYFFMKIVRQVG